MTIDKDKTTDSKKSYHRILESTTIIGGSSVINIALRIIRVKFLAVFLQPSGMGLFGVYSSIADLIGAMAGMGVNNSGVRQIAEASGTGNYEKIARTTFTLRRTSLVLGLLGGILLILLRSPISRLTFGDTTHSSELSLLSFGVFLVIVSNGQIALIQGMRKIGDLAKVSLIGALFETIFSIPVIYVWGRKGIVPFLLFVSAIGTLVSWWYARKVKIAAVQVRVMEIWAEVKPLLRLGYVIMASALMTTGTMYLLRVLVAKRLGLEAVGLYQAAASLSYIYVGFILEAMGKDFYPRLTAIAHAHTECNELINQQVEVGLLLAAPGMLATLTFAPMVIRVFYSAQFVAAYEILRWQILGVILRVVSWPLGFLLLAKGKGKLYFWTELLTNSCHIGLIWLGIAYFGIKGTGMAFFAMYAFYSVLTYVVARRLTGLHWSAANLRLGSMIFSAAGLVFLSHSFWSDLWCVIAGITVTIAVGTHSIRRLVDLASPSSEISFGSKIGSILRRVRKTPEKPSLRDPPRSGLGLEPLSNVQSEERSN